MFPINGLEMKSSLDLAIEGTGPCRIEIDALQLTHSLEKRRKEMKWHEQAMPQSLSLDAIGPERRYLYHSILSSGDFAVYRSDSGVWDRVVPMFGDLSVLRNRKRMIKVWLRSKLFRRTGLDAELIEAKILAECGNGGDFLRIVMAEMARIQNVNRWAAWGPDNTFYIPKIKRELPDALFIHIIRDGRDVATVLDKKGWIKPLPGDQRHSLLVAGVYWEWMVQQG